MPFEVTLKAERPAGQPGECFYCRAKIGNRHAADCVLVAKCVKVRMTVEYEVKVPAHWDEGQINFHRNGSSWCAGNAIQELEALQESGNGCLCGLATFAYVSGVDSEPFLSE